MSTLTTVRADLIDAGPNDRTVFDPTELAELAASIESLECLSPPVVRPIGERFEIMAGERRFRAMESLGWAEVPAIVRPLDDEEAAKVMLAENLTRSDLDPIAEGRAYQSRIDRFGYTPAELAELSNVRLPRVRERLQLLRLNPEIAQMVTCKQLPISYALCVTDLDVNRQRLAIHAYDSKRPDMPTFRALCSQLQAEQDQESIFDADSFLQVEDMLAKAEADVALGDTIDEVEAEPVGIKDIATRLGVKHQTVHVWRIRGVMPKPRWLISSEIPVWHWADIEKWARETERLPEQRKAKAEAAEIARLAKVDKGTPASAPEPEPETWEWQRDGYGGGRFIDPILDDPADKTPRLIS